MLPPSPREWLSVDNQVYFLLDLVDELDLSAIFIPSQAKYPKGEKGLTRACAKYSAQRLTMLLLYAYCVGIVSFYKKFRGLASRI